VTKKMSQRLRPGNTYCHPEPTTMAGFNLKQEKNKNGWLNPISLQTDETT